MAWPRRSRTDPEPPRIRARARRGFGPWAIEEALKCGAPAAVIGEIWSLKGYSLAASRRLCSPREKVRPRASDPGQRLWPGGAYLQRRRDAL